MSPGVTLLEKVIRKLTPDLLKGAYMDKEEEKSDIRRVVVVGGAGFVGTHLVKILHTLHGRPDLYGIDKPLELIRIFDRRPCPLDFANQEEKNSPRIETVVGDILKPSDLQEAFRGEIDVVFHLASLVDVSLNSNPLIKRVNVDGTQNVIEACKRMNIHRLVYTSTMDVVYSGTPIRNGNAKNIPYAKYPVNDYSRTKIAAEKLILRANGTDGLLTCALRPSHVYGERDPHMDTVLRAVRSGKLVVLLGNPSQSRIDAVYAGNVAHAHVLAALRLTDASAVPAGEAYHISEGLPINWWRLCDPYVQACGMRLPTWYVPNPLVFLLGVLIEILHFFVSFFWSSFDPMPTRNIYKAICIDHFFTHERATRDFGYHPRFTSDEAKKTAVRWFRERRR
ncbi:hypothetical protein AAMO2058_000543600 [Amorphochlora amoebiformis]